MQKEQLQQNMKEKVRVFEDGSIRLLKKGQSGLVHAIFSRFGLVLVLLLLQFGGHAAMRLREEFVAGGEQVARHRCAHDAEADESEFHVSSP